MEYLRAAPAASAPEVEPEWLLHELRNGTAAERSRLEPRIAQSRSAGACDVACRC